MAETIVENKVCRNCSAEVRENTLFCYNCGKSVTPAKVEDAPIAKPVGDGRLRENVADESADGSQTSRAAVVQESNDQPIPKPEVAEPPPLKSAAAMRRKAKVVQPKRVEIVWEEYEGASNKWFILTAILMTLLAIGILYLAVYLK